jgi:hypothetical protein
VVDNSRITRYGLEDPGVAFSEDDLEDLGIDIPPQVLKNLANESFLKTLKKHPESLYDIVGIDKFDVGQMGEAGAEA